MVKKISFIFWLMTLSYPNISWAEMRFSVKPDKTIMALGEPLTIELKVQDGKEALSNVSLDKLKQSFNVYSISSGVQTQTYKGRRINNETMTLILYSLHAGNVVLPALRYMGKLSAAQKIKVNDSGSVTSSVMFKVAVDTPQMFVRYASTLTLDIYDEGNLQWMAPRELLVAGAHQNKLADSQFEALVNGKRYTVHRYAWSLMPLRAGKLKIEFPLLDALKLGNRLRYPVTPLELNILPVPAYLPVHLPIGRLQVTADALPEEIALNRPVNWQLKIQGRGLSEEGLQKLIVLPAASKSLKFYPLIIGKSVDDRPLSAAQTLLVTLPFVALQSGQLTLPELSLPYYDIERARIESVVVNAPEVKVFNPQWLLAQKIALGLLVLVILALVGRWLWQRLRRYQRLRHSLLAISSAKTAIALHEALLRFGVEGGTVPYATLQQWLNHRRQRCQIEAELLELVTALEEVRYGQSEQGLDVAHWAHRAVSLLKRCKFN
jgi:hypothetical protein